MYSHFQNSHFGVTYESWLLKEATFISHPKHFPFKSQAHIEHLSAKMSTQIRQSLPETI